MAAGYCVCVTANPLAAPQPWDIVADGYADHVTALMAPFSVRALEIAAPAPDACIIDVACGPGTLTLLAAPRVASIAALDFSAPMIDRLEREARAAGFANIDAKVADGQQLPFDDNQFGAGFSMFGLMFFPDRTRGFAELFRVLAPGATAVVSSWAPVTESPLMTLMFDAMRAPDPAIPEPTVDVESLANPDRFETELRAAGFTDVTIQRHTAALSYPNAEELWEATVQGSAPMALMRSRLGEAAWAERVTTIVAYLEQHYRPHTPLPTTAFLGVGRKP